MNGIATQTCRYCGEDIARDAKDEWVETRDVKEPEYCPYGWVGRHVPEEFPTDQPPPQ